MSGSLLLHSVGERTALVHCVTQQMEETALTLATVILRHGGKRSVKPLGLDGVIPLCGKRSADECELVSVKESTEECRQRQGDSLTKSDSERSVGVCKQVVLFGLKKDACGTQLFNIRLLAGTGDGLMLSRSA